MRVACWPGPRAAFLPWRATVLGVGGSGVGGRGEGLKKDTSEHRIVITVPAADG